MPVDNGVVIVSNASSLPPIFEIFQIFFVPFPVLQATRLSNDRTTGSPPIIRHRDRTVLSPPLL